MSGVEKHKNFKYYFVAILTLFAALAISPSLVFATEGEEDVGTSGESILNAPAEEGSGGVNSLQTQSGPTEVSDFESLLTAISEGKNIILTADISSTVDMPSVPAIEITKSLTLDLNGHTLATASTRGNTDSNPSDHGNTSMVVSGSDVEVLLKNGKLKYNHEGNAVPETLVVENGAKVTLDHTIVEGPSTINYTSQSRYGNVVHVTGGSTLIVKNGSQVSGVFEGETGTVNNANRAIALEGQNNTLTITDSTVKNTNGTCLNYSSGNSITIHNSNFTTDYTFAIYGGSINGAFTLSDSEIAKNAQIYGETVIIKNNTFAADVTSQSPNALFDQNTVAGKYSVKNGGVPQNTSITNSTITGKLDIQGGIAEISDSDVFGGAYLNYTSANSLTINSGATINGDISADGRSVLKLHGGIINGNITRAIKPTTAKKVNGISYAIGYAPSPNLEIVDGYLSGEITEFSDEELATLSETNESYCAAYEAYYGKLPTNSAFVCGYDYSESHLHIFGGTFVNEPSAANLAENYEAYKIGDIYHVLPSFDVGTVESEDEDKDALRETAKSTILAILLSDADEEGNVDITLPDGTVVKASKSNLASAIAAGETSIKVTVSTPLDVSGDIPVSERDSFVAALPEEAVLSRVVDINVVLSTTNYEIGRLTELPEPVTATIDVSDEDEPLEGFTRKFYSVRNHEDQIERLSDEDVAYDPVTKTVQIRSRLFSHFALGYADNTETDIPAPHTGTFGLLGGASQNFYLSALGVSIVLFIFSFRRTIRLIKRH